MHATQTAAVHSPRDMRDAAQKIAQHNLIAALANFDAVVMGDGTTLRAYNELKPEEQEGYGWMVAAVRRAIWGA